MRVLIRQLCNILSVIAGTVLLFMVALTFADILMRILGSPIPGVYEIIAYLGVAVTGFALPRASMMKAHVYVDIVIDKVSERSRIVLKVITRILVFFFFLITGIYFINMGLSFIETNSVTMTNRIPFYPIVFAMTLSCLAQCLVSIYEIFEKNGKAVKEEPIYE